MAGLDGSGGGAYGAMKGLEGTGGGWAVGGVK